MKKTKTNSWYRKKAVEYAKLLAKHRDDYTCQRCGRTAASGYQIHASHIFPEGKYHALSYDLENLKALCAQCHISWHEHPLDNDWFKDKFPVRYEQLKERAKVTIKPDYQKAYEDLKSKWASICH